jgi:hypothetical protein
MMTSRLSGIVAATCGATRMSTSWSLCPAMTRVGACTRAAMRHSDPAPGRYARRKLPTRPRRLRTYAVVYHGMM